MATASFDKTFVVSDKTSIEKIRQDLTQPLKMKISHRDYQAENKKGIQLLKQRFSNSGT